LVVIDLLVLLPFYLPFFGLDLRALRILRLMRVFRVFKAANYFSPLVVFRNVVKEKREELSLVFVLLVLLMVMASTALYYCENSAQPEKFSSIPAAMWWAVTTLTTVSYGDIYPITIMGKIVASVISILGIGFFALPTGILGAGFVEYVQKSKKTDLYCPHCNRKIEGDV
jgi:voltage-gated potassium channel